MPDLDATELADWLEKTRDRCLTIKDVLEFKPGDTFDFLILDRNVHDVICRKSKGNTVYNTKEFFDHMPIIIYEPLDTILRESSVHARCTTH